MTAIAGALCGLYFLAIGVAFLNDRRRGRRRNLYGDLADDEISSLDETVEPVTVGDPVESAVPVSEPSATRRLPLERGYDDIT